MAEQDGNHDIVLFVTGTDKPQIVRGGALRRPRSLQNETDERISAVEGNHPLELHDQIRFMVQDVVELTIDAVFRPFKQLLRIVMIAISVLLRELFRKLIGYALLAAFLCFYVWPKLQTNLAAVPSVFHISRTWCTYIGIGCHPALIRDEELAEAMAPQIDLAVDLFDHLVKIESFQEAANFEKSLLHVSLAIEDAEYFDGKEKLAQLCDETRMASIPLNLALIALVEDSRYAIEHIVEEYKSMKNGLEKFRTGWSYRYNEEFIKVAGDYLTGINDRLESLADTITECYTKTVPVMNAGRKLRSAFVSQKGRINSNFLDQAGLMEKIFFYVGFKTPKEDFEKADTGIEAASQLAESLADVKQILERYKIYIASFQNFVFEEIYKAKPATLPEKMERFEQKVYYLESRAKNRYSTPFVTSFSVVTGTPVQRLHSTPKGKH